MLGNCYADIIEPWKVELIVRRARRRGINSSDLEDVQQEIVLSLLDFVFDLARQSGCGCVTLDSGPARHDAHRLYLNKGFRISSIHFTMELRQ